MATLKAATRATFDAVVSTAVTVTTVVDAAATGAVMLQRYATMEAQKQQIRHKAELAAYVSELENDLTQRILNNERTTLALRSADPEHFDATLQRVRALLA